MVCRSVAPPLASLSATSPRSADFRPSPDTRPWPPRAATSSFASGSGNPRTPGPPCRSWRNAAAPAHDLVAAKTAAGPRQDLDIGPHPPQLFDDAPDFFERPRRGADIGRPQARTQQLVPGENIERQVAIVSVVAVEKAPFLVAVQRVAGGVEIEHDALGLAGLGWDVERGQQTAGRGGVESDLLVTAGRATFGRGQLQAVKRALAGAGFAAILWPPPLGACEVFFAAEQGQQRVAAQMIVIVEIS